MKKLILSALAIFALTTANAQEEGGFSKGDVFVTGSFNYNNTSVSGLSSDAYNFNPSVGYFVSDNISLAAGFNLGKSTMTIEGVQGIEANTVGGTLGAVYFFTPANKFSFTAGLGLGYNSTKLGTGSTVNLNTFSVAAAPGINYFLSKKFAVNAALGVLGYSSSKFDTENASAINTFTFGVNAAQINFGLTYKF